MMSHSDAAWPAPMAAGPHPAREPGAANPGTVGRAEDPDLASMLRAEDAAAGLSVFDRVTCPFHRTWAHRCISSPTHVIPLTGHRWCAECRIPANVAVDEVTGRVSVTCAQCGLPPRGFATEQIIRACQASLSFVDGRWPVRTRAA